MNLYEASLRETYKTRTQNLKDSLEEDEAPWLCFDLRRATNTWFEIAELKARLLSNYKSIKDIHVMRDALENDEEQWDDQTIRYFSTVLIDENDEVFSEFEKKF